MLDLEMWNERDGGMLTGPVHAAVTCLVNCGHGFVEKSYSQIRDKCSAK